MRHRLHLLDTTLKQAYDCAGKPDECRKRIAVAQAIVQGLIDEPVIVVKEKTPIADLIDKMT